MEKSLDLVTASAKNPPLASCNVALLHVAMHDAVVASWHWKYTYNQAAPDVEGRLVEPGPDPSYPSSTLAWPWARPWPTR